MLSTKWEYPTIPKQGKNLNHLLFRISSPADPDQDKRSPIVVILILDKSWSMKGEKMDALLDAASVFVNWLSRADYLGIVAYAEDVQVLQPIMKLEDKQLVTDRLKNIRIGTSTNLSGGWLQGLRMLKEAEVKGAIKRAILLTDGLATMGIQDDEKLTEIAKNWQKESISTTTIGIGSDFSESSLQAIARAGGGNFYYIDSPEKTSEVFFKEFENVGSLYAQATELRVEFPLYMRFLEILGDYPYYSPNGRSISIQIGDLRSDEMKKIVTVVEIDSDIAEEVMKPLSAELVYSSVAHNMKQEQEKIDVTISFTDQSTAEIEKDKEVEMEILVAWSGKTMLDASRMAQTDVEGAIELLRNMKERLLSEKDLNEEKIDAMVLRVDNMLKRLREDANTARKHLLANGIHLVSEQSKDDFFPHIPVHDEVYLYATQGEVDLYNIPELKQRAMKMIKKGYAYMIFDLSKTPFVDSSAIGGFIQISNWLQRRGGMLIVIGLTNTVKKIFELTHLNKYIQTFETEQEARSLIADMQAKAKFRT